MVPINKNKTEKSVLFTDYPSLPTDHVPTYAFERLRGSVRMVLGLIISPFEFIKKKKQASKIILP